METPQQTPQQNSEYDFILNASEPKKQIPLPIGSPNSKFQRALLAIGMGIILVIIAIVIISFLKNDGGVRESLLKVSQTQQEITRIVDNSMSKISSQNVKNLAVNTSVSVYSAKQQLDSEASLVGITFKEKELIMPTSTDIDAKLDAAKTAGTFDATLLEVLKQYISDYKSAVSVSFGKVSKAELKQMLKEQYQAATLLSKQLESTQP